MRRLSLFPAILPLAVFAVLTPAFAVTATDSTSAISAINTFDDTLLSTMKDAKTLGYQGRFDRMAPAVDKAFDLAFMARYLVGPKWSDLTPEQQSGLVKSFRNYTIGQYANRFNGYDGETLAIVGQPTDLKNNIRVQTVLTPKGDAPVKLDYIMQHENGGLKVIDIFLQGTISQLATQRSQFQSVLSSSGVDGLIAVLDKKGADAADSTNAAPGSKQSQ